MDSRITDEATKPSSTKLKAMIRYFWFPWTCLSFALVNNSKPVPCNKTVTIPNNKIRVKGMTTMGFLTCGYKDWLATNQYSVFNQLAYFSENIVFNVDNLQHLTFFFLVHNLKSLVSFLKKKFMYLFTFIKPLQCFILLLFSNCWIIKILRSNKRFDSHCCFWKRKYFHKLMESLLIKTCDEYLLITNRLNIPHSTA